MNLTVWPNAIYRGIVELEITDGDDVDLAHDLLLALGKHGEHGEMAKI